MKLLKLFKNSVVTNEASFSTEEELQAFISKHEEQGNFLLSDKTVVTKILGQADVVTVVPATHTFTVEDISAELEAEATKEAKIAAGKAAREACLSVLDYIAGCNLDKELSIEQITSMQQTFASVDAALKAGRPTFARNFIEAIVPDGYILTEEEKSQCLLLLTGY